MMDNILDLDKLSPLNGGGPMWEVTIGEYRYRLSSSEALVYKGDAVVPSYTISGEDGCDCKSAVLGGRVCKHMQAVHWVGDGVELSTEPSEQSDGLVDLSELLGKYEPEPDDVN